MTYFNIKRWVCKDIKIIYRNFQNNLNNSFSRNKDNRLKIVIKCLAKPILLFKTYYYLFKKIDQID